MSGTMRFLLSVLVPLYAVAAWGWLVHWPSAIAIGATAIYCYMRGRIDEWRVQQDLNDQGHT